jgi:hypothetical protein
MNETSIIGPAFACLDSHTFGRKSRGPAGEKR